MITLETDRLVEHYLRRLEAAAAVLPRERRAELVVEIREHLDEALREVDTADEVAVRNVLERLGPPEEIVQAAEPPETVEATRSGRLEIAAVVALAVPLFGWLIGIVLVVVSRAWSTREKALGLLLALLPALLPTIVLLAGAESGSDESVPLGDPRPVGEKLSGGDTGVGPTELFVMLFAGLPSALFLGWRLRAGRPG